MAKNRHLSEEEKAHISAKMKGKQNALGFRHTDEAKQKIAKAKTGEGNPNWKGDRVGYMAVHTWLRKEYPYKRVCERCEKKRKTEYANISGDYKRERSDYEELCISCHRKEDRKRNPHKGFKLTGDQVSEIKTLRSEGWKHQQLADRFDVSRPMISMILNGSRRS